MRRQIAVVICSAVLGLMTLSSHAIAQQKTAKECREEWRANKAANQASGVTEKAYVAQCRGGTAPAQPTAAPAPPPAPAPTAAPAAPAPAPTAVAPPARPAPLKDVMLTDVVPTGYQAAEQGGIQKGDTVVVFGAGPVGIMAARCAWFFGAGRVIIIDHLDYRLEFAKKYSYCEAYNFKEMDDPVLFIKKITDWYGADVCIDAVGCDASGSALHTITGKKLLLQAGAATALHWAINSVKKGGILSIIGVYGPPWNLVSVGSLMNKGITVRGNQASVKRLLPKLIDHVMSGRLNPKGIISHRIPLEEVGDAYHMFSSKARQYD